MIRRLAAVAVYCIVAESAAGSASAPFRVAPSPVIAHT